MNQTFLIIILFIVSSFAALKFYSYYIPSMQVSLPQDINLEVVTSKEVIVEIPQTVKEFNEINSKITGLTCDKLKITIKEGIFSFPLEGRLRYEKDKKFRMIVGSIIAKELDLGSNDEVFWFWSRKNKDPGLFYAKHEDYFKTRLKTPFNPIWIMKSLGVDVIDAQNVKIIDEPEKSIMVIQLSVSASGKTVATTTFINRTTSRIDSVVTTDIDGKVLISIEIKEYKNNLPKHIIYIWYEEDKKMEFELINPRIGEKSQSELWNMPNMDVKTDMGVN